MLDDCKTIKIMVIGKNEYTLTKESNTAFTFEGMLQVKKTVIKEVHL